MVTANAAMIVAYGVGSLIGPTLGGSAMDAWNPNGLLGLFVALFACFLGATWLGRSR
jgi:predicted MFS family arabinose efflux permease